VDERAAGAAVAVGEGVNGLELGVGRAACTTGEWSSPFTYVMRSSSRSRTSPGGGGTKATLQGL